MKDDEVVEKEIRAQSRYWNMRMELEKAKKEYEKKRAESFNVSIVDKLHGKQEKEKVL